jgi:hypothetical protein
MISIYKTQSSNIFIIIGCGNIGNFQFSRGSSDSNFYISIVTTASVTATATFATGR